MTVQTKDRTLQISRIIDASRELVFDAWTSPGKIARWWGPNGFTTTTKSMDFRVDGEWIFTMHEPDGTDYPNRIIYTAIKRHDLITYDHFGKRPGEEIHFQAKVTFEKVDGRTKVTLNMVFPTKEARNNAAEFGAVEGGQQTLGRLADFLEKQSDLH